MKETMPIRPWQLVRMIFEYWAIWVSIPNDDPWFKSPGESIDLVYQNPGEGLFWYNGHNATFWYILNVEWYRMNNKLYAYTGCKHPFDDCLGDFDESYLEGNYP